MSRNLEQEMDEVKRRLEELSVLISTKQPPLPEERPKNAGHTRKPRASHPDPAITAIMDRMEHECGESGETGCVTYMGVFSGGGSRSSWVRSGVGTDGLLKLIENRTAAKVLNCIGNNDRLSILLALLRQPMTVAALVEDCGYNSTGQVYHHLKPLIAADLVMEAKGSVKGTYTVKPHRVQGVIMLLAGVRDMIDVQYSTGDWDSQIHGGATMVDERYLVTAEETQKIIQTFFASTEPLVLKGFPPKEKKKLVILRLISEQFEQDRRYSEKEVNAILRSIYEDYATIRRDLIEYGFMDRTRDCRAYWLTQQSPPD
jgi:hypothetical protein